MRRRLTPPLNRRIMARAVALVAVLAGAVVACDEPQSVSRGPADVHVHVYVERDDTLGMGATDTPLRANVTLHGEESPFAEAADSTGADGVAIFGQMPGGRYTVRHEPTDLPAELEPQGSDAQTVVTPFTGDTAVVRFVYRATTTAGPPASRD